MQTCFHDIFLGVYKAMEEVAWQQDISISKLQPTHAGKS